MSAIAGILNLNGAPVSIEHSSGMMKALEKFPANDIQTWHKDNLFLGCHAQWITPESISEQLPFYDYARGLAITADAIIDNREELFQLLQIDREDQKKITDSQLILLAYHKWAEESPKYLVGDFAYVIWDEKDQKLFAARDFSGNRALYYFQDGQRFVFCTVMKPILGLPFVESNLNEQWLAEFLAMPNVIDKLEGSLTVYKNIEEILPSHCISIKKGSLRVKRYCTLEVQENLRLNSTDEYVEAFQDVFQKAVSEQTRTYRKVGVRLSGGLDSGAVASFAANELKRDNKELYSFSYVPVSDFNDWSPRNRIADERPYIQSTVNFVGNITPHYLDFKDKSPYSEIDSWLEIMEMPYKFVENSFWLKGIYEEAHKDDVGVLFNGARGNYSISWGPAIDYYAVLLKKLKWIKLYKELSLYTINKGSGRKHMAKVVGKRAFPIVNSLFSEKDPYIFPIIINKDFLNKSGVIDRLNKFGVFNSNSNNLNVFENRKSHFLNPISWNLNGVSRTKATLFYSLADRDPTNDLRVIKFCLSVPDEVNVHEGLDRALIRKSTKNFLPDHVRLNHQIRGIQGADAVHRMMHSWDNFLQEISLLIRDPLAIELFDIDVLKQAVDELGKVARPEYVLYASFKVLMRSIIAYRFLKLAY
jgi:asparagine synthase (glutamine-hydrolysing)